MTIVVEIAVSLLFAYFSYEMIEKVSKLDEKVDRLSEIVLILKDRNRDNRTDD